MATDTAPVPEGSPDPPTSPTATTVPAPAEDTGIMAALMAAVEPVRPVTATGAGARPDDDDPAAKADPDGAMDRSAPGVTSASFKAPEDLTGANSDAAGTRHKEGVFKTLIRAGATRWAKGGGTANKRLDIEKARAGAHQVRESRTTTVMKSPGLPTRNGSGGVSGGGSNSGGNGGRNSGRHSTGNGSTGTGRGGNGGGSGEGGRGSSDSNRSGVSSDGRGTNGKGSSKDSGNKGKDGSSGGSGASGKAGKNGKAGAPGGAGSTSDGSSVGSSGGSKDKVGKKMASKEKAGKEKGATTDLKKGGDGGQGQGGSSGSGGGSGSTGGAGKNGENGEGGTAGHRADGTDTRTPLQRSRETGHGDGSAVRTAVDHVKAYAKGAKDGYQDTKEENSEEHVRLDKEHAERKAKKQPPKDDPKQQGTAVTGPSGQTLVIAPPDEGDDGVSTDVKPLLVKEINANTLTLGTDGARGAISRKELRNFKQYERKLAAKESHLIKVADACKSLEAAAEDEAKDCQQLAEQAKAVEGGEKLAAKLTKLADAAKAQAAEAAELHKRAKRAAEMCKVVLTNIGTRYAPLYKAVVDSDETKPAELRFYNDKGSYAPAA